MIGVGVTNALLGVRQMMDPTFKPPNTPQDVVSTSAAYGVYMSVSSNLRYQVGEHMLLEADLRYEIMCMHARWLQQDL